MYRQPTEGLEAMLFKTGTAKLDLLKVAKEEQNLINDPQFRFENNEFIIFLFNEQNTWCGDRNIQPLDTYKGKVIAISFIEIYDVELFVNDPRDYELRITQPPSHNF